LIVKGSDILGRVERAIEIKAPAEKVWEMLALDRLLEWQLGFEKEMKSVEYTSEVSTPKDKYRMGATAHGIPPKQGEPINCHFEITESLENEKITHRLWEKVYRGTMAVLITYILEPVDGGTKLTLVGVPEMPWGILGKIIEPLILRMGIKDYERSLKNLKSILEK